MEIILKEDIIGLGFKNDIVNVKNGYANNYLVPTGKAEYATESAKKQLAEDLRQKLLNEYGIGTIAIDNAHLRVAFSSLDESLIEQVYSTIYKAAEELA